jgi:hypothetical protein
MTSDTKSPEIPVEPSDPERAEWPDVTREYVEYLESVEEWRRAVAAEAYEAGWGDGYSIGRDGKERQMSDDLVKHVKDRADWLVDAVATATQNRAFLRGEPECDEVACEAIEMNGEKAMLTVAKPLTDRIEELESEIDYLRRWQNAAFLAHPNIDLDIKIDPEAQEELKGKTNE